MSAIFKVPTIFTAIDKMSSVFKMMGDSVKKFVNRSEEEFARFERKFRNLGNSAHDLAKKSAITGLALAAPLVVAANNAITFEDRMADVAKTTGLSGKALDDYGKSLLDLAPGTRTSIKELQEISAIGGSMGVAKKELLGFTDSVDKFNVALGSDFGGVEAAAKAISGLKVLFKETRDIDIASAITKTGSAINALSAQGVNVPEVTEFVSRVGQLPDAIKPSIQATTALAATFNKAGITAEIGSRAFGDILLTAGQNLPKFAKQMNLSEKAAKGLLNADPTEFAVRFAKSLDGLDAVQLAKTLKQLKLGDAGAIKAVGALSSGTEMLAKFQGIANEEFAKGTSLLEEYNTKNSTTAAKLKKAQNSFEAFSIILGQELLPVVNDLLMEFIPMVKSIMEWARANPKTIKTILILTATLSALSFIISGASSLVWIFSKGMLFFNTVMKLAASAQLLLNAAMTANPIAIVIAAIAALIALVVMAIKYYNKWGAALFMFLGPLGMIINLIQSFRRNWDMIVQAFKTGGVLEGFKAIGKTILDTILMPLQQVMKIIASVTGADWAESAMKSIEHFRKDMGLNVTTDESGQPLEAKPALASSVQQAVIQKMENTNNAKVSIDINDPNKRTSARSDNDFVTINTSSTLGWAK